MTDTVKAAAPLNQAADEPEILAALAEAVLAVPGVAGLEPTLSTNGPGLLLHRKPTDGIKLLTRAGTTAVDVNIATKTTTPARTVAQHVEATIAATLDTVGCPDPSIAVSILVITP